MSTHVDECGFIFALIGNIPATYRSADLRNYFSQFIEGGGFECFHFRHRPERRLLTPTSNLSNEVVDIRSGVVCKPSPESSSSFKTVQQHGMKSTDLDLKLSNTSNLSHTDSDKLTISKPTFQCQSKIPSSDSEKQSHSSKTCCCIVKVKSSQFEQLRKMYHRKHWLDSNYESIPGMLCFIEKVKIADTETLQQKYKTRRELKSKHHDGEHITQADIDNLMELKPPKNVMPGGNVGTPTKTFLDLIKNCKLPPSLISKLGLRFPKTRAKRMYGDVPYEYDGDVVSGDCCDTDHDAQVHSATGHQLDDEGQIVESKKDHSSHTDEDDNGTEETEQHSESEEDDDGCEEWERHEALNDDPANVERNKERLFEEELEVTWEKGGPGLVWYTDAQYWAQEKGDFEEQTSDDWDVDMGAYYEATAGDKDARDSIIVRRDLRRRKGIQESDDFPHKRGKFEVHTKGIGKKILTQQGWNDGEGLGSKSSGIADAIDADGQLPKDKSGLGYRGEKLQRHNLLKPQRQWILDKPIITSIYDNPEETDPQDRLYRRLEPHHLKYRGAVKFMKSSVNCLQNEQVSGS